MKNKQIYIVKKLDAPEHGTVHNVISDIVKACKLLNCTISEHLTSTTAVIVVIGGDGTMMYGMRLSWNIKSVLGFNIDRN